MAHTSFYRTYRPTTFADMVGQKHIERTLKNAVATDQVAHAYLFSGPRGTGKTTTARILAAALLCEHVQAGEPDGDCEQCREVASGKHPDVMELDAASRTGVDNVRDEIIARVQFAPVRGRSKIYIIDEVHMLSTGAFNAFLKTLEEPPAHVVFILCTTDPQKVPETIRSRCQQFEFRPYTVEELTEELQRIGDAEDIKAEPAALALIAAHARGGMRDAITTYEQLAAFTGNDITVTAVESTLGGADAASLAQLVGIVATADTAASFVWVADQVSKGADLPEVIGALIGYVRDLYVLTVVGAKSGVIDRSVDEITRMTGLLKQLSGPEQIARMLDLLGELAVELRWANEPRTLIELAFVRMTRPESDLTLDALAQRIEALEAQGGGEGVARPVERAPSPKCDTVPGPLSPPLSPQRSMPDQGAEGVARVRERAPSDPPLTSAAPAPSTDAGRLWREVLAQIKQAARSRYALFADAELEADPEGGYVLSFPAESSFAMKAAKEADNVTLLREAFKMVGAQVSTPRFVLRAGPQLPGMPAPEVSIDDIEQEEPAPAPSPTPVPAPAPEPEPLAAPSLQATPPMPAATTGPAKDASAIFADLGALPLTGAAPAPEGPAPEDSAPEDPSFDALLIEEASGALDFDNIDGTETPA